MSVDSPAEGHGKLRPGTRVRHKQGWSGTVVEPTKVRVQTDEGSVWEGSVSEWAVSSFEVIEEQP